jgi:hypothetical protein
MIHHGSCRHGERRYSRGTIDRWLRSYRAGGLEALKPPPRSDTGAVRTHPELYAEAAALRLELPSRSAAQIASILYHRHGVRVAERTVRQQLRRAGLHRGALTAEPKAFGRYGAERPNERWITDVLVGPFVPFPRLDRSVKAKLFLIVDDHSRLLVDGRFFAHENARACQELPRRLRLPIRPVRRLRPHGRFRRLWRLGYRHRLGRCLRRRLRSQPGRSHRLRRLRHRGPGHCVQRRRRRRGCGHTVEERQFLKDRPPSRPGQQVPPARLRRVAGHDERLQRPRRARR